MEEFTLAAAASYQGTYGFYTFLVFKPELIIQLQLTRYFGL